MPYNSAKSISRSQDMRIFRPYDHKNGQPTASQDRCPACRSSRTAGIEYMLWREFVDAEPQDKGSNSFPGGEEHFRCTPCGRLSHKRLCPGCRAEDEQDKKHTTENIYMNINDAFKSTIRKSQRSKGQDPRVQSRTSALNLLGRGQIRKTNRVALPGTGSGTRP